MLEKPNLRWEGLYGKNRTLLFHGVVVLVGSWFSGPFGVSKGYRHTFFQCRFNLFDFWCSAPFWGFKGEKMCGCCTSWG